MFSDLMSRCTCTNSILKTLGLKSQGCLENSISTKLSSNLMLICMSNLSSDIHVAIITLSLQISRAMEEFDVKEQDIAHLTRVCPNVKVWNKTVVAFHPTSKVTL